MVRAVSEAHIDRITNLSCEEVRGVIRKLVREARILFAEADIVTKRDFNVLNAALTILDSNGITAMSRLGDIRNVNDRFGALVLTSRAPRVAEGDPTCVDVVLTYDHIIEGNNQNLNPLTLGGLPAPEVFGKGKTSIREKETNFFYPNGIVDPDKKTQILIAHQYAITDTGIPPTAFEKNLPRVVFQGGHVKAPFPESTHSITGLFATPRPRAYAKAIIAATNSVSWIGDPAGTWLCTEVQWEVNNPAVNNIAGLPNYRMTFEFHHNPDGWEPEVAFKDERYGRPPADVVQAYIAIDEADGGDGVLRWQGIVGILDPDDPEARGIINIPAGVWKVPMLKKLDFDAFFGTVVEGANVPAFGI